MESSFPSPQSNQTPPSWWSMSKEDPKSEAFRKGKKLTHQRRFVRKTSIWKYQFKSPFSLWGEPEKVVLFYVFLYVTCKAFFSLSLKHDEYPIHYYKRKAEIAGVSSQTYECLSTLVTVILRFSFYYIKTHSVCEKRFLLLLEIESALGKRSLIKANQNAIHQHKFQVD